MTPPTAYDTLLTGLDEADFSSSPPVDSTDQPANGQTIARGHTLPAADEDTPVDHDTHSTETPNAETNTPPLTTDPQTTDPPITDTDPQTTNPQMSDPRNTEPRQTTGPPHSNTPEVKPLQRLVNFLTDLEIDPRRKSRFTYRQLAQLAHYDPSSPLRIVAHIDLDAFYAQCEVVRLGLDPAEPLVVRQWNGIIAVNYPARAYGIKRTTSAAEALQLCPHLHRQHVATWRAGHTNWAYRDDAHAHVETDKVSLDPYRIQSRRILAVIKNSLPRGHLQKVEKASIDEVFLDLSAHVHALLIDRFPELLPDPPVWPPVGVPFQRRLWGQTPEAVQARLQAQLDAHNDPKSPSREDDYLPLPLLPTDGPPWSGTVIPSDEREHQPITTTDWDDILLYLASEIIHHVRHQIWTQLHYTCSAGLARNKMLSKLGSAHHKPNAQTIIPNRAVHPFLAGKSLQQIRSLGGKMGDFIVQNLGTDDPAQIRTQYTLERLVQRLGPGPGPAVFEAVRGHDTSEVSPRTIIKSMLSAKAFREPVRTPQQVLPWLVIFTQDLYARLVEDAATTLPTNSPADDDPSPENQTKVAWKRRPRNMLMHYVTEGNNPNHGAGKSRQIKIPPSRALTEALLLDLAKDLFHQVLVEHYQASTKREDLGVDFAKAADSGLNRENRTAESGPTGSKTSSVGFSWVHLSVSVSSFEDVGLAGNHNIGSFLVHGSQAKALQQQQQQLQKQIQDSQNPEDRNIQDRSIHSRNSQDRNSRQSHREYKSVESKPTILEKLISMEKSAKARQDDQQQQAAHFRPSGDRLSGQGPQPGHIKGDQSGDKNEDLHRKRPATPSTASGKKPRLDGLHRFLHTAASSTGNGDKGTISNNITLSDVIVDSTSDRTRAHRPSSTPPRNSVNPSGQDVMAQFVQNTVNISDTPTDDASLHHEPSLDHNSYPTSLGPPPPDQPYHHHSLRCPKCPATFADPSELQSHQDWHFATELQSLYAEVDGQDRGRDNRGQDSGRDNGQNTGSAADRGLPIRNFAVHQRNDGNDKHGRDKDGKDQNDQNRDKTSVGDHSSRESSLSRSRESGHSRENSRSRESSRSGRSSRSRESSQKPKSRQQTLSFFHRPNHSR